MVNKKKVIATLSFGKTISWLIAICAIFLFIMVVILTFGVLEFLEMSTKDKVGFIAVFPVLMGFSSIFILINFAAQRTHISKCMEDSVQTTAQMHILEYPGNKDKITFSVEFEIYGQTIVKTQNAISALKKGRKKCFWIINYLYLQKLCNKQINVLYSPKFNEVLFIQQPTDNKYSTKEIK